MAKTTTAARCSACGHVEPRWLGRCPACDAWGTMGEEESRTTAAPATPPSPARPVREVTGGVGDRAATGIGEFDRVLGGGLVAGSVTLLGGEPGAGKSTLLLQAADALARSGRTVLYVSAEESPGQVRLRADRLGALDPGLLLASEADMAAILELVALHRPGVLVVDSVQTVREAQTSGQPGGTAQVRACAAALCEVAKAQGMATVLIGHVTKDGQLAGPRVLEHLVDAVCELEGDRHHALRLLRSTKNRFGAAGEVGCFEMTGDGLAGVDDAGRLFLGDSAEGTPGVAVTLTIEGSRPLACEVQALAAPSTLTAPRRVASGLDPSRLALLAAVLQQRADVPVGSQDLYVSTVGGFRLAEPAVDLALATAIASSCGGTAVPRDLIVLGEVGLAGDLRLITHAERRLAEARRLGFSRALLPGAYDGPDHGLRLYRARDLTAALSAASCV